MSSALAELDTYFETLVNEPVLCESSFEREVVKLPPHLAQWYALTKCIDGVTPMCEKRRLAAMGSDGWRCPCGSFHKWRDIRWVPIK